MISIVMFVGPITTMIRTYRARASITIAVPHCPHQISRMLRLRRHGRRQGLKPGSVDRPARLGDAGKTRHRPPAPGDIDGIASLDPIDEFAQMGFGISQIDRIHAALLTP